MPCLYSAENIIKNTMSGREPILQTGFLVQNDTIKILFSVNSARSVVKRLSDLAQAIGLFQPVSDFLNNFTDIVVRDIDFQ